jgi:hypothetical protein
MALEVLRSRHQLLGAEADQEAKMVLAMEQA